jgi:hypothetical protein
LRPEAAASKACHCYQLYWTEIAGLKGQATQGSPSFHVTAPTVASVKITGGQHAKAQGTHQHHGTR